MAADKMKLNLTTSSAPRLGTLRSRFSLTRLVDAVRLKLRNLRSVAYIALADAVEDAKTSPVVSGTQGRYTEPKRG